jgi:hypothetical protein
MSRIDLLPEEIISEIYKNIFSDSLDIIKKIDTCNICNTNLVIKTYMGGDYLCITCHKKMCLQCWHRCNNYGMGFQPFNRVCQLCRNNNNLNNDA